jgi:hypothetical protein
MEEACSLIAIQIDPSPKSSVFPLVGGDLPTITIVAMPLRLAGRLEAGPSSLYYSNRRVYSSTPGNSPRVPTLEANGWTRYATVPGPVPLPAADLGKQLNPPFLPNH